VAATLNLSSIWQALSFVLCFAILPYSILQTVVLSGISGVSQMRVASRCVQRKPGVRNWTWLRYFSCSEMGTDGPNCMQEVRTAHRASIGVDPESHNIVRQLSVCFDIAPMSRERCRFFTANKSDVTALVRFSCERGGLGRNRSF